MITDIQTIAINSAQYDSYRNCAYGNIYCQPKYPESYEARKNNTWHSKDNSMGVNVYIAALR